MSEVSNAKRPSRAVYVPPHLRKTTVNVLRSTEIHSSHGNSSKPSESCESNFQTSWRFPNESESNISLVEICDSLDGLNIDSSSVEHNGLVDNLKDTVKVPVGCSTSSFTNGPKLDYAKLSHIVELYGFPADSRSMALEIELRPFVKSDFIMKWVDDTHCLVVFDSELTANRALESINSCLLKARPVEEASLAAKWKIAKSPGDWALPYKKRPPCDSSVASRIISSHLGLPRPELSPALVQARKEAKERREKKRQAQLAMWGDDV